VKTERAGEAAREKAGGEDRRAQPFGKNAMQLDLFDSRHSPPPPPRVFVRHPRARRYIVRVTRDGTVRITIPRWGSRREGERFADAQRAWIDGQIARWTSERTSRPDVPSPAAVEALKARARLELPPRLLELAAAHGLVVARISIRNQRWRWGSCSRAGHICLNWRLVTMPDWVRDYVLVHELMHLKRMDHSRKFWKLVAAACPRFREARQWLRECEVGRMF
jgi:predicted metal-dependent hydrolase